MYTWSAFVRRSSFFFIEKFETCHVQTLLRFAKNSLGNVYNYISRQYKLQRKTRQTKFMPRLRSKATKSRFLKMVQSLLLKASNPCKIYLSKNKRATILSISIKFKNFMMTTKWLHLSLATLGS